MKGCVYKNDYESISSIGCEAVASSFKRPRGRHTRSKDLRRQSKARREERRFFARLFWFEGIGGEEGKGPKEDIGIKMDVCKDDGEVRIKSHTHLV